MFRLNYNHNSRSYSRPVYEPRDVAGTGAREYRNFERSVRLGLPGISFTSLEGSTIRQRGANWTRLTPSPEPGFVNRGKHNWRFGGELPPHFGRVSARQEMRRAVVLPGASHNTHEYAPYRHGYDLRLLLGFPQQTSLQSGAQFLQLPRQRV